MVKKAKLTGKKVKIVANMANHCFPMGTIVTITGVAGGGYYNAKDDKGRGYQIATSDFMIAPQTVDEIKKTMKGLASDIGKIQDEMSYWEDVLSYMGENDLAEFDEMEFKTYSVIKTINKDMSDMEKAKIIAKIINTD